MRPTAPGKRALKARKGAAGKAAGTAAGKAAGEGELLLQRSCKLLVHEIGHLLGLD